MCLDKKGKHLVFLMQIINVGGIKFGDMQLILLTAKFKFHANISGYMVMMSKLYM